LIDAFSLIFFFQPWLVHQLAQDLKDFFGFEFFGKLQINSLDNWWAVKVKPICCQKFLLVKY